MTIGLNDPVLVEGTDEIPSLVGEVIEVQVVQTEAGTEPYVVEVLVPGLPGPPGDAGIPGLQVVEHGTDPDIARPSSPLVLWIGTAEPANALSYDIWKDS